MRINFECDNYVYDTFRDKVGNGNVSKALRDFMENFIQLDSLNDPKIDEINTKLIDIKKAKLEIDAEYAKYTSLLAKSKRDIHIDNINNR